MSNKINQSINIVGNTNRKKTYSTPTLHMYGEVKKITAGGSINKNETNGHPNGRL